MRGWRAVLGLSLAVVCFSAAAPAQFGPPPQTGPAKTDALSRGNKAVADGDLRGALAFYDKAAEEDPKAYEAVVLAGDTEMKLEEPKKAMAYFARAVAIDPTREAAYRLWGDALLKEGNAKAAEEKYVEAILAEPYVKAPRQGLKRWADAVHAHLADPPMHLPVRAQVDAQGHVKEVPDGSTAKRPAAAVWLAYASGSSRWGLTEFKKRLPGEAGYRDSLAEITEQLRTVLEKTTTLSDGEIDPTLKSLRALEKDGMLESCILLDHWDAGIEQDYPAYRAKHLDVLRAYMFKYVIHPAR